MSSLKIKVGDFKNSYEVLERSLRRIDGLSESLRENDEIRHGDPHACLKILKMLLLCTVRDVCINLMIYSLYFGIS